MVGKKSKPISSRKRVIDLMKENTLEGRKSRLSTVSKLRAMCQKM